MGPGTMRIHQRVSRESRTPQLLSNTPATSNSASIRRTIPSAASRSAVRSSRDPAPARSRSNPSRRFSSAATAGPTGCPPVSAGLEIYADLVEQTGRAREAEDVRARARDALAGGEECLNAAGNPHPCGACANVGEMRFEEDTDRATAGRNRHTN